MCGHMYIYIHSIHSRCVYHVCMYVCLSVRPCVRACVSVCVYTVYACERLVYMLKNCCWFVTFFGCSANQKKLLHLSEYIENRILRFISSIIPIIYMAKDKSTRLSYTKGGSLWVTAELRNSRSATCATSASAVASPHSEGSLMNGGHLIHWQIVKFVTWKSDLSTHTGCDRDDTNGEWSTLSWGSKTIVYIIGCKLCLAPTPLWYVTGFYMSVCVCLRISNTPQNVHFNK